MGVCPKCNKPVDANLGTCPECGQSLTERSTGTLDVQQHFESKSPDSGLPTEVDSTLAIDNPPGSRDELDNQPGSREPGGTLGAPDLEEHQPAQDSRFENTIEVTVPDSREQAASDGETGEQDQTDEQAKIQLTEDEIVAKQTLKTRNLGSDELPGAGQARGKSGTAGRLKRLWAGAAGSSANPMHTLKRDEPLATDSVFERVAPRVLATDPFSRISEAISKSSGSQSDIKRRVEECIAIACEGGKSDVADYNLTGFLGKGAMGIVLKARQRAIGRDVAIKMIQPGAGGTKSSTNVQKKKFFYEAQITGMLDHPNIVPVYDLGVSNDILFYSMKQITGVEWQKAMAENSRDENLDVLMKVADAVAFSHKRHIIHRDLKPENIMIGEFGEVLVTDWGCAVDLSRNEAFGLAGSPAWMAPEMGMHDLESIGPRSDIYLLGAMLYWIVSGYPPHPGKTLTDCLRAVQRNSIIPVESDDPLLDIAYRAMETDPDDRYQTVEEMQEAIRENRRHAESIKLSDRSEISLKHALASKDYEGFARTLFGFQEAIDLWPENENAISGLAEARLAYGQAAYDKSDYDLCLQTLDEKVPAENELRVKAAKAQQAAREREARFRTLRRAFAAVVLVGLGVTSVLAGIAAFQWQRAEDQREVAVLEADNARKAQGEAESAKQFAEMEKMRAEQEADNARRAEGDAKSAQMFAEMEKMRAEQEAENARIAEAKAKARARQVELGAYQSNLALALGRVGDADLGSADSTLNLLLDPSSYVSLIEEKEQPKVQNWAWKRVDLLSNRELLSVEPFGDQLTAVAYAEKANVGAIAVRVGDAGEIQLVELDGKRLSKIGMPLQTDVAVDSLSLSPDGGEVLYSLESANGESTVYTWAWKSGGAPLPVAQTFDPNRPNSESYPTQGSIQGLAMSSGRAVGGINSGLWIWNRAKTDWQAGDPTRVKRIRGKLLSLQLLENQQALVMAKLNDRHVVHVLKMGEAASTERPSEVQVSSLDLQPGSGSEFDPGDLSAVAFGQGRLILGTTTGRLFTVPLSTDAISSESHPVGPDFKEMLPKLHENEIRSVQVHADGTLLTTAFEPVVHVWKKDTDQESGWRYDTHLAGPTDNVGGVAFMVESSLVLGLGEGSQAIVWDIERQKQRRQLRRLSADGSQLKYTAPVIQVVTSSDNRRAVSVDRNAKLDSWDVQTGKTLGPPSQPTFSFVGHTPGATFYDMAIDAPSGTLVTSALLPAAATAVGTATGQWEFCKWDLASRKMLDRWTNAADDRVSGREISLLEGGKLIMYASEASPLTVIKQADRRAQEAFNGTELGSVLFAMPHPKQSSLAMIVKANGAMGVFDSKANRFIDLLEGNLRDQILADRDVALLGEWSPGGERFFLLWATGGITELGWDGQRLSIVRDIRGSDEKSQLGLSFAFEDEGAGRVGSFRINSRWQVDLKVRQSDPVNLVYIAIRFPGPEGKTRLTRIAFPKDPRPPVAKWVEDAFPDRKVVLNDAEVPELEASVISRLPISLNQIVGVRTLGDSTYFASADGTVYRYSPAGHLAAYGAPPAIAAAGNAEATRIVILHEGGIMSQANWENDQWNWTQLITTSPNATDIDMSPDGNHLLIGYTGPEGGERELRLTDGRSGNESTIADGVRGKWLDDHQLALVLRDGSIAIRSPDGVHSIGRLPSESASDVRDIQLFHEAWADESLPENLWLVVHTTSDQGNRLHYFTLDSADDNGETNRRPPMLELGPQAAKFACSPVEGILVVGGSGGNVTVFFASPTLDEVGTELFSLEGHSGAAISSIRFTADGKNVVTTDSLNRLFGWMSEDPLDGVTVELPGQSTQVDLIQ